jgi:hypothetical protein
MVHQARLFRERVANFRSHARTLDEHSHEYAAIFEGNEWTELVELLNQLESLDGEIHNLLSRRRYSEADLLLNHVSRKPVSPEEQSAATAQHELEALINWEHAVHGMLRNVIHNLEIASEQTRRIASQPATKSKRRQPTLMTLADLKKSLIEGGEFI